MRAEFEQVQARVRDRTDRVGSRQTGSRDETASAAGDQLRDVQQQRDQIVDLGEGGTCPICARPLGTHFRSVLEVLDTQIETITVDGKYFRARIEQLAAMPPEVAALDERRRQLPEQLAKLERRLAKAQAAVQEMAVLVRDLEAKEKRRDVAGARAVDDCRALRRSAPRRGAGRRLQRLAPLAARAATLADAARARAARSTQEARTCPARPSRHRCSRRGPVRLDARR